MARLIFTDEINYLLNEINPEISFDGEDIIFNWNIPDLITAIYYIIALTLENGSYYNQCKECHKFYTVDDYKKDNGFCC